MIKTIPKYLRVEIFSRKMNFDESITKAKVRIVKG